MNTPADKGIKAAKLDNVLGKLHGDELIDALLDKKDSISLKIKELQRDMDDIEKRCEAVMPLDKLIKTANYEAKREIDSRYGWDLKRLKANEPEMWENQLLDVYYIKKPNSKATIKMKRLSKEGEVSEADGNKA